MNTNIYNPYVPQELFLMHHGILGQRWGKKNGPPYPLGVGDHSASEKKAGWRKSLAAAGRGTVKVAKAVGKGTVKTAKFVNKAAIRMGVKPKRLMSDEELEYAVNRLHQEANYKRALKGKFIDVTEAQRKQGDGIVKQTMSAIGKDLLVPTAVGVLKYKLAEHFNENHAEGEKVISKVETIFSKGNQIGYRNSYFYDKNGKPVYREPPKKKGGGGGEGKGDSEKKSGGDSKGDSGKKSDNPKKSNVDTPTDAIRQGISEAAKMSQFVDSLKKIKPVNDAMNMSVNSLNSSDMERWADRLSRMDAIDTPMQSLGSGTNDEFIKKLSKMGKIA